MPRLSKRNKKLIIISAKICVAAVCMIYVGRAQDWQQIKEIFKGLNIAIFALALGLFFFGQVVVAIRWNYLLRTQSVKISHYKAIKLHLLGLFYNNFLPSAIGGDFLRAWYVTKHTEKNKRVEAAFSVFFDRALGLFGMAMIALVGYFMVIYGKALNLESTETRTKKFNINDYMSVIYAFSALALIALILLFLSQKGRNFLKKIFLKIKSIFVKLIMSLKLYAKKPLSIICALFLTYSCQLLNIFGMWVLGKHLGVNVSFKYYLVFFPLSWIIGAVPLSIGGIGIVEGLLTGLFVWSGSQGEPAFFLSLCQRAILLLVALPGIYIHLVGAHLPGEEFFVDTNQTIV